MALALNNLQKVNMQLNKETKPNQTKPNDYMVLSNHLFVIIIIC